MFVCIRCSGIHRGMGTHISRVKSVDLDTWTDEQTQSVLKWGNSRANKYWEAKLAPGHVPSEAKIENFIRTKYEAKRWAAEGPVPDPSTLDAPGDDDIPLGLVKEKINIERSTSQRATPGPSTGPTQYKRNVQPDLFGDDPPPRANSAAAQPVRPQPKAEVVPPKQTRPADSLLGLDFGAQAPPPNRPVSAAANPGAQSRPDLKQSILSLYAQPSRPPPQQQQQQPNAGLGGSMGGMPSPPMSNHQQQSSFGGFNDAFSSLSFSNAASPPQQTQPKPSAFSSFGDLSSHRATSSITSPPANVSGGSFFDIKASQPASQPPPQQSQGFSSSGFGSFDSPPAIQPAANVGSSSGLGDLFDFSAPSSQAAPARQAVPAPQPAQNLSVFNLSAPQSATQAPAKAQPAPAAMGGWSSNNDAWASNDAWNTASPAAGKAPPIQTSTDSFGWGSGGGLASQSIVPGGGGGGGFSAANAGPPKVSADEEFGGWSSAAPPMTPITPATSAKPTSGYTANEDLFSNVWE